MDVRLKVALGATVISAIFAFGAGGNWLVFLVLTSMAIPVTCEFGQEADENPSPAFGYCGIHLGWNCSGPSWLEVPEAALAISRGRYWPRCGIPLGSFQADLSSPRRLWERKLITVLMAAKVTRQVRQKSL